MYAHTQQQESNDKVSFQHFKACKICRKYAQTRSKTTQNIT